MNKLLLLCLSVALLAVAECGPHHSGSGERNGMTWGRQNSRESWGWFRPMNGWACRQGDTFNQSQNGRTYSCTCEQGQVRTFFGTRTVWRWNCQTSSASTTTSTAAPSTTTTGTGTTTTGGSGSSSAATSTTAATTTTAAAPTTSAATTTTA